MTHAAQEFAEVFLAHRLHDPDGADVGRVFVDLGQAQDAVLAVEVVDREPSEANTEPSIELIVDADRAAAADRFRH